MNIYVASSWRNEHQPRIVQALRAMGHEVYDFRNPSADNHGFHWSEIDADWQDWGLAEYLDGLDSPIAGAGFRSDFDAMKWADTCVLVLPCGRSAHLEAGYFVGAGKRLVICVIGEVEPELMYLMANAVCGGDTPAIALVELRKVMLRLSRLTESVSDVLPSLDLRACMREEQAVQRNYEQKLSGAEYRDPCESYDPKKGG